MLRGPCCRRRHNESKDRLCLLCALSYWVSARLPTRLSSTRHQKQLLLCELCCTLNLCRTVQMATAPCLRASVLACIGTNGISDWLLAPTRTSFCCYCQEAQSDIHRLLQGQSSVSDLRIMGERVHFSAALKTAWQLALQFACNVVTELAALADTVCKSSICVLPVIEDAHLMPENLCSVLIVQLCLFHTACHQVHALSTQANARACSTTGCPQTWSSTSQESWARSLPSQQFSRCSLRGPAT